MNLTSRLVRELIPLVEVRADRDARDRPSRQVSRPNVEFEGLLRGRPGVRLDPDKDLRWPQGDTGRHGLHLAVRVGVFHLRHEIQRNSGCWKIRDPRPQASGSVQEEAF
jgi:hypothetical protein